MYLFTKSKCEHVHFFCDKLNTPPSQESLSIFAKATFFSELTNLTSESYFSKLSAI